jgi:DNA-binding CsgD family transcriptional regulator/sugar-specific transcriptional regulator TrmB
MTSDMQIETAVLLGLGLEQQEAVLWQTMLTNPRAGVEELTEILGVSAAEIAVLLDRLADRALSRASRLDPRRMVPVAAEAGLSLLLQEQERAIAAHRQRFENYRDQITHLIAAQGTGSVSDQVELLVDVDAIQARFEQVAYSARAEIHSMLPGGTIPVDVLEQAWPLDTALLSRAVSVKLIYQETIHNDPATLGYVHRLAELGAQIRTTPLMDQRLFICDRRIALLPINPEDRSQGAILIRTAGIINSLVELFEYGWAAAKPLDAGRSVDLDTGLTDAERELLILLAAGQTDAVAAKRLDVSVRTVRRMMADIMLRLGAKSRFDAGVRAAKRGWL